MTQIGRIGADQIREAQMELLHKELTDRIIGGSHNAYDELGYGFLGKTDPRESARSASSAFYSNHK